MDTPSEYHELDRLNGYNGFIPNEGKSIYNQRKRVCIMWQICGSIYTVTTPCVNVDPNKLHPLLTIEIGH